MSLNLSKTFFALSAGMLLLASSVTSSDARPQASQLTSPQSELTYYHSDYNSARDRDNSCFRSTGLPDMYACSAHGG